MACTVMIQTYTLFFAVDSPYSETSLCSLVTRMQTPYLTSACAKLIASFPLDSLMHDPLLGCIDCLRGQGYYGERSAFYQTLDRGVSFVGVSKSACVNHVSTGIGNTPTKLGGIS